MGRREEEEMEWEEEHTLTINCKYNNLQTHTHTSECTHILVHVYNTTTIHIHLTDVYVLEIPLKMNLTAAVSSVQSLTHMPTHTTLANKLKQPRMLKCMMWACLCTVFFISFLSQGSIYTQSTYTQNTYTNTFTCNSLDTAK